MILVRLRACSVHAQLIEFYFQIVLSNSTLWVLQPDYNQEIIVLPRPYVTNVNQFVSTQTQVHKPNGLLVLFSELSTGFIKVKKKKSLSLQWFTLLIPALRRSRQNGDNNFEVSLAYIMGSRAASEIC